MKRLRRFKNLLEDNWPIALGILAGILKIVAQILKTLE